MTQDVPGGERLAKVEAAVESLVREMSEVRIDLRELRTDVHSGMDRLHTKIDRNFLWTIGIIMTMWVTLITAIIVAILVN